MLELKPDTIQLAHLMVSVAGCLGYDVLEFMEITSSNSFVVSVAGCLGYDVLAPQKNQRYITEEFQLLVV